MAWPIRFVFLSVATLGVWAALANETGATRPHFTLLACVLCAAVSYTHLTLPTNREV